MSTKLKQQQEEAPATSGGDVKTAQVVAETNNNNNESQQQLEHQPTTTKQHEKNKISPGEQLKPQQQPRKPETQKSSASARMKINDCDKQKLLTEASEPKSGHGGGSNNATNHHHEDDPKMTNVVGLERTQENDGQSSRANIVSGQQAPASSTGGRDRRHQANGHVADENVAPAGTQREDDASRDKDQQDRRRRQPLEAATSRGVASEVPGEPRLTQKDTDAAETVTPQQHHRSADDSSKKSSVSPPVAKEKASQINNNNDNQKTLINHEAHPNSTTNSSFHLLGRDDPTQVDLKQNTSDHELQLHVDSEAAPLSYELEHQQQPLYSYYSGGVKAPHTKRLSYLQSLLFRKWPCLALSICIMSSLVFGILLSGLALYLTHGASDCSELASRLALAAGPASPHVNHHLNHHLHQHLHQAASLLPSHELLLDAPIEAAASSAGTNSELTQPHGLAASNSHASPNWSSPNKTNEQSLGFQRLPSAIVPQHYELFIWPYIAEPSFHFNGSVEIELRCHSATDNITLHSLDLDIDANSLRLVKLDNSRQQQQQNATSTSTTSTRLNASAQAAGPKVARLSQDKQLQYAIVHLDGKLEPGQDYLLRMDFAGVLNDDLAGFYKIKYERQNSSETTWIAASQFQATDARRAFPCFDEPLYKATFGIKIRHWKNMTALSNMPIVSSEQSQDGLWITDTFARSQRMSTYLVAFAVTNFESRTAGNITVWTRPGLVHTAEYSLKIADKILRYYEDFFGIAYPLPKMDMIALPDFNAGAMENWGLITYRETAMLYDAATSSVANKQRVAVVVAHELAHQWFGNLVTPKWWDDLWLNEGFASFVEYIGVDHVEPEWRMLDQFPLEEVQNVFKLDGLSSSHQISIPVNNPDEISEIFDHISYAKGASVIRMMSHFLTEPVFKLGLRRYLRALKYNNAEQSDLWWHLTAAQQLITGNSSSAHAKLESINVGQVMNSWTLQTGYPLVTLTRAYQKGTARLHQVRYEPFKLLEQSVGKPAAAVRNDQRWEIPITYTSKAEQNWQPTTRLWMHQNQSGPVEIDSRLMPKVKPDEWMLLNVQQVGYYRVNYDERNWRLLVEQLLKEPDQIGATNRAQLLDDLFEMARSSLVDYELAMESTKYLHLERDYMPWESVLLSFGYIDNMLERTPLYGDWQDYFAQLIEPYYQRYRDFEWTWRPSETKSDSSSVLSTATMENRTALSTVDSNDVLDQYNQVNAISWACSTNNQHCIERAKRVFAEWRGSGVNRIVTQLRYNAYCTAIAYGSKEDWDFLWRVYEREQGASERDRILRALGCSRELWILTRYLEWTFSKSKPIRRQDGSFVFRVIAKNNYGRDIAFNFMRERWPIIKEYYGKSSFSLGHLIKSVAASMNTQSELDQLKSFYESIKSDVGTGKRSFQIAIEEVESNVYWRQRHYKNLEQWLQRQKHLA